MDLLTSDEHAAISALAEITGMMFRIIEAGGDRADHAEVAHYVHGLQNMVLANAAARAYPGQYRLIGGNMADPIVAPVELEQSRDEPSDGYIKIMVRALLESMDAGNAVDAGIRLQQLREALRS